MSTFDAVADLPVEIESYSLEPHAIQPSPEFERLTTVIQMHGGGLTGLGEDVNYGGLDQVALQDQGPVHDLTGAATIGELCELVGRLDLFPSEPMMPVGRLYRRWAFESAALDLALAQAGTDLAAHLGRRLRPLTFVGSMRLGTDEVPSSIEPLRAKLDRYPGLRFKLDPTADWSDELIEQLRQTGAVATLDLKGQYSGTPVDVETDPELYRKLAERFPDAWLEDPDLEGEAGEVLEPYRDRITWDAPIHSVADIEGLAFAPKTINIKPSRLGGLESLMDAYDYCDANGIAMYGGGQWELAVGRQQIQYMAALFHPDTPNDTAPGGYNASLPEPGLPTSPMQVDANAFGKPN